MLQNSPTQRARPSEEGYVLVAVVFMTVILVLSLAVAIPRIRESIQRDREIETMQRGKQYIRAVQLYYRKFNAYPPNVDALVKTNNIRFLRKKYVDPTTGKDEWKPVLFGQNKTPQAMGFFGQPLAAAAGAGIGPGGGNAPPGAIGPGIGLAGSAGNGLSNTTTTGGSTDAGSTPAAGPASGTAGGTDPNGNPTTGGSQAGGASPGAGSASTSSSTSGQTFGGAGIIGFSPQSPKQSLYVYKKKNHYNEWEFLYSPLSEQQTMTGGNTGTIGQPASSTTTPVGPSTPTTPTTPSTPDAPPSNPQQ
jgi:type II secretory pathway pseudopilin PulG